MKQHRRPVLGLVYVLTLALFVGLSIGAYQKALPGQGRDTVTFTTTQVGLGLKPQSDVEFQGVQVGTVRDVTTTGTVATVTLAIDPDRIGEIPASADAFVVPKTLFGDKFVDLRGPADGSALEDGAVIEQSTTAVELGQIFDRLVPVLRALQPERLTVVLSSLADALEGRGDDIARVLRSTESSLGALEPSYDDLVADIQLLADTADVYTGATPDLMQVLRNATGTSNDNLVPYESELRALLDSATATTRSTTNVLRDNTEGLVKLAGRSREVLKVLAYYSREIPCILATLRQGNKLANLAAGVRGPYIALSVDMVTNNPGYTAPQDLPNAPGSQTNVKNLPPEIPSFDPHCPQLPQRVLDLGKMPAPYSQQPYGQVYDGESPQMRTSPSASTRQRSPQEALARALAAESMGVDPVDVPPYAELLMMPMTADGEVTVR